MTPRRTQLNYRRTYHNQLFSTLIVQFDSIQFIFLSILSLTVKSPTPRPIGPVKHHFGPPPTTMSVPQHTGAADSYYHNAQPAMQQNPPAFNGGAQPPSDMKYEQPPPTYEQDGQGVPQVQGDKTFNQVFKIDKPTYNDIWAGILVGSPWHLSVKPFFTNISDKS